MGLPGLEAFADNGGFVTFCQVHEKTWVVFRASIPVLGLPSRSLVAL